MALSYTDVYTVAEYGSRVQDIETELEIQKASMEGTVFFAGQKIQEQINILQQKEASIFELLGVSNLQQLNMRIQRYQQNTFTFNGSALRSTFTGILEVNNQKSYRAFEKAVRAVINDVIKKDVNNYLGTEGLEKAANAVLDFLNEGLNNSHTKFTSTQGMKVGRGGKIEFFPNSFTTAQIARWKTILKQKASEYPEIQSYFDSLEVTATSTDDTMTVEFTWFDKQKGTGGLTPEQAKKMTGTQRSDINRNIINLIKSSVSGNVDMTILEEVIQDVLASSDGLAFFVGQNINKITGILGEIQGMYYLRELLGDKAKVIWRGGTKTGLGNTDPHQDIQIIDAFKRAFGIQIKNTTSEIDIMNDLGVKNDLNKNIDFSEGSISTMVSKMASIVPVDDSVIGLLETYYGTKSFNVPYHYEKQKNGGRTAVSGNKTLKEMKNPKSKSNREKNSFIKRWNENTITYKEIRKRLEDLNSSINSLMSLFAAAFMYLDAFDFKNENDANALFLIGGTAFVTASDVLETVLNDLISETNDPHFTINMSSNDANIIDALNSGKKGNSYSSQVINGIKLTSSFKF